MEVEVLKKVRYILSSLSAQDYSLILDSSVLEWLQPSFEQFFGLLILMKYYYYQDADISPVLADFYSKFKDRISDQYPQDDDARRMYLISTHAYFYAHQLKNETDLEMVTKNAIRDLFPN